MPEETTIPAAPVNGVARKSPTVPPYLHHQESGQAVVRINGKDCYLGAYGSPESKRLYSKLIAELMLEDLGVPIPESERRCRRGGLPWPTSSAATRMN